MNDTKPTFTVIPNTNHNLRRCGLGEGSDGEPKIYTERISAWTIELANLEVKGEPLTELLGFISYIEQQHQIEQVIQVATIQH